MWKWDQGRMDYFQYDALCAVARFVAQHDIANSSPASIRNDTGLKFAPKTYSPWRNYARVFKLCLIVSEQQKTAVATDVAKMLSKPGLVTCDEYLHFLVEATTDPSPALSNWKNIENVDVRSPLCFSLKYILAKGLVSGKWETLIDEIVGAYQYSQFTGKEDDNSFINLLKRRDNYNYLPKTQIRQARESIKFISQISYLHCSDKKIVVSLDKDDAERIFQSITPISGDLELDGNDEIIRRAGFFKDGSEHDFFGYESTIMSDVIESGFNEGNKIKKTHVVIERNSSLRAKYFKKNSVTTCDSCTLDTNKKYPWSERVLDLHHILPLSSGTRVDSAKGTLFDDLVAVCPTCHRAIHKYYDVYLKLNGKKDFENSDEAKRVYKQAKEYILNGGYHA